MKQRMSIWDYKICSKCKDKKTIFEYTFNQKEKDGVNQLCNECLKLDKRKNTRHN